MRAGSCVPGHPMGAMCRRTQSILPASWCDTHWWGPCIVAEHSVKRLSALRLMLFLHMFTEKCLWPLLSLPHTSMWLRSPISMLVHTPARWIAWLDSSLVLTLPRWISLASVKLFTAACAGVSKENQSASLETVLHVVHPSCWVDLQGKMPMNILRRLPQA